MQILVGADGFVAMFGHHTIHADTVTGPITSYSWMFEGMVSGPTSSECFDRSLALSKNGSMVPIGDEFYDAAGKNNTGQVQVYRYENPDFVAVGKLLMGGQGAYFGWAIAVTENGTMLVVGAAHQNFNDDIPIIPGYVKTLFKLESSVWVPFENDLTSPDENHDGFGRSISMSASHGGYLAVGGNGLVQAFRLEDNVWTEMGSTLYDDA